MPINTNFQYEHTWYDKDYFLSQSGNEDQVRAWLQELPDEIRDALNALAAAVIAENIPFTPTGDIQSGTVQAAIEYVMSQVQASQIESLADGVVTTPKLHEKAVTTEKIADYAVTNEKLGSTSVTQDKIRDGAVSTGKIADSAVVNYKIADGAVTPAKFDATVYNKLAQLSGGKVLAEQISAEKVIVNESRTLVLSDAGKALYCSGSSDITLTVPLNSDVAFPVGTEILIFRYGTGAVTLAKSTGVYFLSPGATGDWVLPKRYSTLRLKKWSANDWSLEGVALTSELISDGAVTKAKLAQAVQDAIDAAYVKPGTGIPKTDLASAVQTSLGKADSAYQKADTGIPKTDLASAVQTSLGKADTAYQQPSGGIPSSDLAAQSKILLASAMYGTSFPANPVTGQLFFKKV